MEKKSSRRPSNVIAAKAENIISVLNFTEMARDYPKLNIAMRLNAIIAFPCTLMWRSTFALTLFASRILPTRQR